MKVIKSEDGWSSNQVNSLSLPAVFPYPSLLKVTKRSVDG